MSSDLDTKRAALREQLRAHAPLVIAYSGGVDSAFLLAEAHAVLGDQMLGVIADSPSLPRSALKSALDLAESLGARVEVVKTLELDNPDYAANPPNRCYFCKAELFQRLDHLARDRRYRAIAYGENLDDLGHDRPGRTAAAEFKIIAPLRDALLSKAEIRTLSHALGLPTADAPAQPCLSSRIPWGTPVTPAALLLVEQAEEAVRARGYRVFRVRHLVEANQPPRARVLFAADELPRATAESETLTTLLTATGYASVELGEYQGPSA